MKVGGYQFSGQCMVVRIINVHWIIRSNLEPIRGIRIIKRSYGFVSNYSIEFNILQC